MLIIYLFDNRVFFIVTGFRSFFRYNSKVACITIELLNHVTTTTGDYVSYYYMLNNL